MSGMWPAGVDMRTVFPMHAVGPIICSDPTGEGRLLCLSDIQSDNAHDKTESSCSAGGGRLRATN